MKKNFDFSFLSLYDERLSRAGNFALAHADFNPTEAVAALRRFGETLTEDIAVRQGVRFSDRDGICQKINVLFRGGHIPKVISIMLHELRDAGNDAAHDIREFSPGEAQSLLGMAFAAGSWFNEKFGPVAKAA